MKKVCILGNSHAACLKLAWDEARSTYGNVSLTFFADRRAGLMGLQPKDGLLVPDSDQLRATIEHTSGGLGVVDVQSFDAILLVGLQVIAYPHAEGHFSSAAIRQWLLDHTPRTGAFNLARKIRKISRIPVFVAHQPLECVDAVEAEMDLLPYRSSVRFMNERLFKPLDACVLEQPEQTITNGFYTKRAYSSDAKRLDVGDETSNETLPPSDRRHMNATFGSVVLSAHLPKILASTSQG